MPRETRSARLGSAGVGDLGRTVGPVHRGVFRKEGEYWAVGSAAKPFRLKDSRGFGYIAHLLRHPGTEFHVLDLVGGIAGHRENDGPVQAQSLPRGNQDFEKAGIHIGSLGDAGEMLDDQAKVAYRRRLVELREELEEAKEHGNVERAEQAEQEIDVLTSELSRAVGLGGRNRRAASASERARQNVAKTIKSVVERIAQSDAALGDILSRCIKTGTFCSYQPDPDFPIAWEFGGPDAGSAIEPAKQPRSSGEPVPARADRPQPPPVVLEASPFSLAERTTFVGRESERSAIRAMIDRALSGHGSLVMLEGGPGVGKTRLAMEMSEYAWRVGFRCSVGRCYERDEPIPFLPFAEIIESNLAQARSLDDYRRQIEGNAAELAQIAPSLRRVFPDLPRPLELPPAQRRHYLFQSFAETLGRAAQTRSQLIILEDLHWADESTLALLIHLSDRVAQLPVVIIGTFRDAHSENNPALIRTLEELIRLGVRPLKLDPLSEDAVAQMLDGLSQRQAPETLVRLIFKESQGNPFFIGEVYRHLLEEGKVFDAAGRFRTDIGVDEIDVPENLRLIIGRRLQRLGENEKRALAAAAVIGRSFSFQLLNAINQVDIDELFTVIEKAQQMGIIVPSAEGPKRPFIFAHELVRQTLLAGISEPRQQQLHARVAQAIERLYPDGEHAGDIAEHLLKAGSFADRQTLVRWLTMAGKGALAAAAFEEARRSFRSALSHLGPAATRDRADLLTSLAMAERGLERWEMVLANRREALEIYVNLDDRKVLGRSFIGLTEALIWCGNFQEAAETATRGLTYLPDGSADRLGLLAALGQANAAAANYLPAQEALREASRIASERSDPKLEAIVLGAWSIVNYHFFRLREVAEDSFRSEQLGGLESFSWQRGVQLRNLYQTLLYLGRLEEAAKIAGRLEPLASKIGQSYTVALCHITQAWLEFGKAPDLAKLEAILQQMSRYGPKAPEAFSEVFYEAQLSLADFFCGNWTSALSHAQASCRPEPGSFSRGLGVGTLFRQMAYAGDRDGAFAILDEKPTLPISGQPNTRGSWWMLAMVIEGLVILGEQAKAGQLYPLARELVGTGAIVLWPNFRFSQTIAGIAASAARQWEAAEDHFQIALQQAESFPNLLEQAEIRRFHSMMLIDRAAPGDREKAQTLLRETMETYMQIGMPRHIEMTQTLLARCR